jgi:hypothetical protein
MKPIALIGLILLAFTPALAQTTTKLCVPTPGQTGVPGCQDVNATNGLPVKTVTLVVLNRLDNNTVETPHIAIQAILPGHRTRGGWIKNPEGAKPLCIAEIGSASGTKSIGNVTCIGPGVTYTLAPSADGVSVVSADGYHSFSGFGWSD